MSDDEGEATLVIRMASWRGQASIAIAIVGIAIHLSTVAWLRQVVGAAEFKALVFAEPFWTLMIALPGLLMLFMMANAVWEMFRGPTITLSDKGFRLRIHHRSLFVRWSDVKRFRVERPTDSMFPILGWDHHDDAMSGNPIWEGPKWEGHRTTTLDSNFGSGWAGGPDQLCKVFEDWRTRYSG